MPIVLSSLPLFTILIFSLPLVISDLKSYELKALPLILLSTLIIVVQLLLSPAFLTERILTSGILLLGGGLIWVISGYRFGLGDVIYLSILAMVQDPFSLYFTVLTACVAGFLFYGYHFLRFRVVAGIPLPFVPVLYLSFTFIEVPRWLNTNFS